MGEHKEEHTPLIFFCELKAQHLRPKLLCPLWQIAFSRMNRFSRFTVSNSELFFGARSSVHEILRAHIKIFASRYPQFLWISLWMTPAIWSNPFSLLALLLGLLKYSASCHRSTTKQNISKKLRQTAQLRRQKYCRTGINKRSERVKGDGRRSSAGFPSL
jgi:hypothetical protein